MGVRINVKKMRKKQEKIIPLLQMGLFCFEWFMKTISVIHKNTFNWLVPNIFWNNVMFIKLRAEMKMVLHY